VFIVPIVARTKRQTLTITTSALLNTNSTSSAPMSARRLPLMTRIVTRCR
jgi:hypothetical protein